MKNLWRNIETGLLYAGAAVGVSHLVQSTRAGADYGLQLIVAVLLINFLKYPFFKIGTTITLANGKNILHSYLQLGRFWLGLFLIVTLATMFNILSAILAVCSGILQSASASYINNYSASLGIVAIGFVILLGGGYATFTKTVKYVVVILSISAVAALFLSLPSINFESLDGSFSFTKDTDVVFLIALLGWMPAPLDLPAWQSLWTEKKLKTSRENAKFSTIDFNIGYWGTTILAVVFLLLGAIVVRNSGVTLSNSAVGFSGQLIGIFTTALGSWSGPIIFIAALATMLSTFITCLDAFPRVLAVGSGLVFNFHEDGINKLYRTVVVILGLGSCGILLFSTSSMKDLIDFATTVSFLVTPIFAWMNLKVSLQSAIQNIQPSTKWEKIHLYFGFAAMLFLAIYFLIIRFF